MSKALELIAECKTSGNWAPLAEAIPYAKFLGISIEHASEGLVCKMAFAPTLVGNPTLPALHGGTLGALLESTAIFQLMWESETVVLPKTINITVDYLHSARPVDTYARGIITKQGRRVVNVRAEAWQADRAHPIATANAHFLIL